MKKTWFLVPAAVIAALAMFAACPNTVNENGPDGNDPDYVGPYNPDLPDGPVGSFRIHATTSHPQGHVFMQTQNSHSDFIAFTVINMNPSNPTAFQIEYTIKDYFDTIIEVKYINFNSESGSSQTLTVPMNRKEIGHFTVEARIMGGIPRITLPAIGTRPTEFITYAVLPDPALRRMNATLNLPVTAQDTIKPGVDKSMFFGMDIIPGNGNRLYDNAFNPVTWLGIDATRGSELKWDRFWTGGLDNISGGTDVARFNLFATVGATYTDWDGVRPVAGSIMVQVYVYMEMLAHMPRGARTSRGWEGGYAGELSAHGEAELVKYCEGIARVHIVQAAQRPHHYYQILWEPDEWWNGWLPREDADDTRVRAYEIAYETIHRVYDEHATQTGDPSWRQRAVVLGPTSSGAAVRHRAYPWHENNFKAGLWKYIDGLSIHPYNDVKSAPYDSESDEESWADLMRDIKAMVEEFYDQRPSVGSGEPFAKKYDKPFFWGTEQGTREAVNGPLRGSQLAARQSLTMMGEGFDANHHFCFMDYNSNQRYGYFYNCSPMQTSQEIYVSEFIAPKKHVAVYSALTMLMKGYKTEGRIPGMSGTQFGYKYKDTWNGDIPNAPFIYALWDWEELNTGSPFTLNVAEAGKITVFNVIGQDITDTNQVSINGRIVSLTLTENVLYVKVEPGL